VSSLPFVPIYECFSFVPRSASLRRRPSQLTLRWRAERHACGQRGCTSPGGQKIATLNSTVVVLVAFGCTFGAALAALFVRSRLPAQHLEGDSKDVVKLVLGLVATITALVLGLLISSAHSAYDAQESELQQLGVHLFQIDRTLAQFGPDAAKERQVLRDMVAADVARIWENQGGTAATNAPLTAQLQAEALFTGVASLTPKTELERFAQSRALQLLSSVGETRRLLVEQSRGALSRPFLIVLVSWASLLFFGFGLLSRSNVTVVAALCVGALSVAGAIFLILEMNQPYAGWMQVSSAPLQNALAQMGR
jgi:hypothetical protein